MDCELCHDTGWYGDKGPGRSGNSEYVLCECQTSNQIGIDEHWREQQSPLAGLLVFTIWGFAVGFILGAWIF